MMFLISFVDVAFTAVIFEIPNFLYDWALDNTSSPPPKNCEKKKVKQEQNLAASSITCLL